jgi:Secretion system C-terminal sorting domain
MHTLQEIGPDGNLGTDDFVTTPAPELTMYPNPARESITLENNNDIPHETLDVAIYDATGRQVIGRGEYIEGQGLDISMLANGYYFVKSTTEDKQTTTKKLIKQ